MQWNYDLRDVFLDADAQETRHNGHHNFHRFEDAYLALEWRLSRTCHEIGTLIEEKDGEERYIYVQSGDIAANTPEITVAYTFDDNRVTIYDLKLQKNEDFSE